MRRLLSLRQLNPLPDPRQCHHHSQPLRLRYNQLVLPHHIPPPLPLIDHRAGHHCNRQEVQQVNQHAIQLVNPRQCQRAHQPGSQQAIQLVNPRQCQRAYQPGSQQAIQLVNPRQCQRADQPGSQQAIQLVNPRQCQRADLLAGRHQYRHRYQHQCRPAGRHQYQH